jgi:chitin disaccharide deacetylase
MNITMLPNLRGFKANRKLATLNRMGFANDTKLLIINADDFGLCSSVNQACIFALEKKIVTSASIMVPCPGSMEAIAYSKLHPEADLGIHLTLTSEWDAYKWKPILGDSVPSLTDKEGFMHQTRQELKKNAKPADVEKELRAQIEVALTRGLNPTHLDSHMFTCFLNPEFLRIYQKLGKDYGIKVLLNREKTKKWFGYNLIPHLTNQEVPVDELIIARHRHLKKGLPDFYRKLMGKIKPGLNCLLIHPAFNDAELKAITAGQRNFNDSWRRADLDFFTSDECQNLISNNNIRLITWKEIMQRMNDH